jgi:hypothetical protein
VGAAVDVGIDRFVIGARGIEHGPWFLRARSMLDMS